MMCICRFVVGKGHGLGPIDNKSNLTGYPDRSYYHIGLVRMQGWRSVHHA
jgi:hypothetical protein